MCNAAATSNVSCSFFQGFSSSSTFHFTAQYKDMYYFALMNCVGDTIAMSYEYEYVNPNGQQLGWDLIPLPLLYTCLFCVWLPITVIWCINWFTHRRMKIKLHIIISMYPISKTFWSVLGAIYWHYWSLHGNAPKWYTILYESYYIFNRCVLGAIFLLIARGYCIVEDSIGYDKLVISGVILMIVGTELGGILYGGLLRLLVMGSYAVIVFLIFVYINRSMDKLQQQRNDPSIDEVGTHLHGVNMHDRKRKMLRKFNMAMVAYVVLAVLVVWLQVMFLFDYTWVVQLMYETLELGMFILIGSTFYLRRDNIYFKLEGAGGQLFKKGGPVDDSESEPEYQWLHGNVVPSVEEESESGSDGEGMRLLGPGMAVSGIVHT